MPKFCQTSICNVCSQRHLSQKHKIASLVAAGLCSTAMSGHLSIFSKQMVFCLVQEKDRLDEQKSQGKNY